MRFFVIVAGFVVIGLGRAVSADVSLAVTCPNLANDQTLEVIRRHQHGDVERVRVTFVGGKASHVVRSVLVREGFVDANRFDLMAGSHDAIGLEYARFLVEDADKAAKSACGNSEH